MGPSTTRQQLLDKYIATVREYNEQQRAQDAAHRRYRQAQADLAAEREALGRLADAIADIQDAIFVHVQSEES